MRSTSNLALLALAAGAHAQLNKLAVAAGKKYFGSATDNSELTDTSYTAVLSDADEFGQITPGNTQKWYYTEPEQGTFTYTEGDVIVDFAQNNSQIMRCHNLVWYNQLPAWISSDSWTNDTLTEAMTTHITNEVTHYTTDAGECYAWDVVNEALSDSSGYRDNIFYETIGEYYIPIAFAAAAAADPAAKLYYNDYSIEFTGTKLTEALAIVDLIQGAGVQIDGVGLQGHFIVGEVGSASALAAVLEQFTAKGVEVAYTEVDVRHASLPPTDAEIEQQAVDYAAVVSACLSVSDCVGITVWDFDDKYSWIPSTFSGAGEACLYDENLSKKPAWTSVSSVLAAAGTGGVASATASQTSVASVAASQTGAASVAVVSQTSAASVAVAASSAAAVAASPSASSASSVAAALTSSSPAVLASSAASVCVKKTKTVYVTASA
ncbi:glycoside hydrolase superfamily [Coniella lustricola]|uniref:Beta-xylanase n=1 Tax=Coniella lustricola TaxID=2025994 RepID=A0A2T2ZUG3_9PEZI|nr:glycoside hydrolase superfamily [Coniella lustricola]